MRKLQVLPTAVNVEMRSQPFRAHRRALDVPARTPIAPGRLPEGLAFLAALPQDEIEWIALGRVDLDPLSGTQILARLPREFAVIWKLPDREIHVAAFRAISDTALLQSSDHLYHLGNVTGCARLDVGLLYRQRRRIFVHVANKALGQSSNGFTGLRCAADNPVVNIGNVAYISQRVAACPQPALCHVEYDHHPRMPEMAVVIDGHPADVHPHPRRIERDERFFLPAEAVVDFQHGSEFEPCRQIENSDGFKSDGGAAAGEKRDKIEEIPARG